VSVEAIQLTRTQEKSGDFFTLMFTEDVQTSLFFQDSSGEVRRENDTYTEEEEIPQQRWPVRPWRVRVREANLYVPLPKAAWEAAH